MAFTRDVIIRLPGPNIGGDTWGVQWTEPGVTGPGYVEVQAKAIQAYPNNDLLVELDGKTRRFTPDDDLLTDYTYKFVGRVNNSELSNIRSSLQTLTSDPNQIIVTTSRMLRKLIRDELSLSDVQQLMSLANDNTRSVDVRVNALLMVGIILTNEL